jgi:hypothetical protein
LLLSLAPALVSGGKLHCYAHEGCRSLAIADVNHDALKETEQLILSANAGVQVLPIRCDISSEVEVEAMVEQVITHTIWSPRLLCQRCGDHCPRAPTDRISTAFFDKDQGINLRGLFFCERAELRAILEQEPLQSRYWPPTLEI